MASPLLIIGIVTILLVVVQVIGLVTGAATSRRRERILWKLWTQRCESRISSQVQSAEHSRQFVSAWTGWRKLRVATTRMASIDCKTFVLEDPDGLPLPTFLPGQFLMVGKPNTESLDPQTTRCYSLCDTPSPDHLQITVKRVPGGLVSDWLHDSIDAGDTLNVRAPAGRFVLDTQRDDLVVGIAAGVGITPIASMARYVTERQPGRPMFVFLSARDGDHLPLIDELRETERNNPNLKLFVLHSRPNEGDVFDLEGRLSIDIVTREIGSPIGSYYLCGPMDFMTSLSSAIMDWGIPAGSVHFESFGESAPVASIESEATGPSVQVEFKKSGRQVAFAPTDSNLLEAAEKLGIEMPADCRAGACGTCLTKLLKGSVAYDTPPAYGPLDPNECLACVGKPTSETTLDA